MNDVLQTVISQYGNSPTLLQMIQNINECVDPADNIDNFFEYVWNINTAQGFGLDIWGRILGVSRTLQVQEGSYFGFTGSEGASNASGNSLGGGPSPTGEQPFYSGAPTTFNYALTDSAYRTLLLAKAAFNITNGSIPAINQILVNLFMIPVKGRTGNAFCTDGEDMTMTYTFNLTPDLTPVELAIISQSGVLPKPAGVSFTVVH